MKRLVLSLIAVALFSAAGVASAAKQNGPVRANAWTWGGSSGIAKAGKYDGPRAKARIVKGIQHSNKVPDKAKPWKTDLQGKPGKAVRPFAASNIRTTVIPGPAPAGAQGGMRVNIGNRVTGTLNTNTGAVRVKGVASPRVAPPRTAPTPQ